MFPFNKESFLRISVSVLSAALAVIMGPALGGDINVEQQEVAPTSAEVKYAVSPHALHLAAATLRGSRHVMLIDGVPGPKFDELVWVKGEQFQAFTQMTHHQAKDGTMDVFNAPIAFSDDGIRFAYVGRQGNEFVIMVDGKEFARGAYTSSAIESLSFTPGGKHLRYIEELKTAEGTKRRLVVDGQKGSPTSNLRASSISWSGDSEHHAYIIQSYEHGYHLVVDGHEDPPELDLARKGAQFGWKYQPVFTGDSAHLITIRYVDRPDPRPKKPYEKEKKNISVPAVFLDKTLIVEAPVSLARQQYKLIADPEEVSVAPAGQNFLSVFDIGGSSYGLFFNDRAVAEARRIDSIAWSQDGKRYAAECNTDHESEFMVIDGKKEPDYRRVSPLRNPEYWGPSRAFTADSSKSVYSAATDRAFLVVENEESDGYAQINDLTLSKQGAHIGFIAADNDRKQLLVVDGKALEPRSTLRDITFTPNGSHYAALSGEDNKARKLMVDGIEQPQTYGSDLALYSFSSDAGRSRHIAFSDDGLHFVYVSQLAPTGQDSKPHRAVCLDGKGEIPCGGALINPFFTPDNRHLVWIAWDGYNVTSYSIYVDGKEAAHFESPPIPYGLGGVTAKVGDFFARSPDAAQMGSDGTLTLIAPVDNVIKKIRVIPSSETSLATFFAQAATQQEEKKQDATAPDW
jgi:hypothetical protein